MYEKDRGRFIWAYKSEKDYLIANRIRSLHGQDQLIEGIRGRLTVLL